MKRTETVLSREQWAALILGMTGLFGLITRLFPALMAGFPLNDGGMFMTMIRDLRLNGFRLPAFTSYNLAGIPFAYPPLGFYIAGLLSAMGLPELDLLRWLPILFNLFCIPAFYGLAKELLKDKPRAAAATMIYALVPDSFAWQIMGGGLTRALGMLFLLLAQRHVLRMFRDESRRNVIPAVFFCAAAVLSHPEVALATASSCALFWIFFGRNRRSTGRAALTAAGTLALSAPWWGSVLAIHGSAPFRNVFYSGMYSSNPLWDALGMLYPGSVWTAALHILIFAGLLWNLLHRRIFLLAWLILPFLVEPRSAAAYAYIPGVFLASQALSEVLPAAVRRISSYWRPGVGTLDFIDHSGIRLTIFGLGVLLFFQSGLFGSLIRNTSLIPPWPQEMMAWVKHNTAPDAKFILITGNLDSMTDPVQEWFPAMTLRNSCTTLQGGEWVLGRGFFPRVAELAALQACAEVNCVEDWSVKTGMSFSHIVVERKENTERLLDSLSRDSRYRLIHENEGYLVFAR